MWQDDSGTIPIVLDPDKWKVANDAKFWEIPCQPVNPDNCSLVQPFGIWINAASTTRTRHGSSSSTSPASRPRSTRPPQAPC